jgi:hypothetical protein
VALSGEPDHVAAFPTAALAELSLPIDRWSDLHPGAATLDHLVMPKNLPPLPG